jgi:hypothetical protein
MRGTRAPAIAGALAVAAILAVAPTAGAQVPANVWDPVAGTPPATKGGVPADVRPDEFRAFTLEQDEVEDGLDGGSRILTLPAPDGGFERFRVRESSVMEPELAARHPEIKTYAGSGVDDPAATVRASTTPLGFHASVRSPEGGWYIDPYYHLDDSVYVSYFGHDLEDRDSPIDQRPPLGDSDPPDLDVALATVPEGPAVKLRTYRLALLTDPSYSTHFGGPQNVTAAKVVLMNRVNQIYEDETAIRLVLVGDNDKLNLDTDAQMTGTDGPCGAAACYTSQQASFCGSSTLGRTRIVIGQIIGAGNYDIGHIALGVSGGGVATLNAVGGSAKARGCTGLSTPVGDQFAVDYVAHEMGHQFGGNHTFNGNQGSCRTNRSAANSVEPGSGSSIMAYAGICGQDDLQPHTDPYWSQRSYDEVTTFVTSDRPPIDEVQTVSLRDFDGTDSLTLSYGDKTSAPIVRGANYTAAGIQQELHGPSEVQTVSLTDYDADGDSYALSYDGNATVPFVRGQNDTAAGIANALQGGNEQQQVVLTDFAGFETFHVRIGDATSAALVNAASISNNSVASAINAIPGFARTATVTGAGRSGFTVTFAGAKAGIDVPAIEIVDCTGGCSGTVRETAKAGGPVVGWPAGGTVAVGEVSDGGYTLTFGGVGYVATDVALLGVTNESAAAGTVTETTKGAPGMLPAGTFATVIGFGGGTVADTGFHVTFGAELAQVDVDSLGLEVTGGSGWVGETDKGGPVDNQGHTVTETGNHAPVVTTEPAYAIPLRTPFALTGGATDSDGDTITYMWEQNDRGGDATALVSNTKVSGPLFRMFGTAADISAEDATKSPSPGLNAVDTNPTRVFPDMAQILAGDTNAATGTCPPGPAPPTPLPFDVRECASEFLPTADYAGLLGDRRLNLRVTARDHHAGGGGIGRADTTLTLAAGTGPFLVTSHATPATLLTESTQTVTWDVAGTAAPPIDAAQVKISLSVDGGAHFDHVLADTTPNDGSHEVTLPIVNTTAARIKIEAVGNVFFDVSDADLTTMEPILGFAGLAPQTDTLSSNQPEAFRNIARGSGPAETVSVYVAPGTTADWLVAGIYADDDGGPSQLLSQSPATPITVGAWNTVSLPAVQLEEGEAYWIAIQGHAGTLKIRTQGGQGTSSETGRTGRRDLPPTWQRVRVSRNDSPASAYASGPSGGGGVSR